MSVKVAWPETESPRRFPLTRPLYALRTDRGGRTSTPRSSKHLRRLIGHLYRHLHQPPLFSRLPYQPPQKTSKQRSQNGQSILSHFSLDRETWIMIASDLQHKNRLTTLRKNKTWMFEQKWLYRVSTIAGESVTFIETHKGRDWTPDFRIVILALKDQKKNIIFKILKYWLQRNFE